MSTKMNNRPLSTLWKSAVENPVDNVEKSWLSTAIFLVFGKKDW